MTTKDYTKIPVSPLIKNRLFSFMREYSASTKEVFEYKSVVDGFQEEIASILDNMKKVTLDNNINVKDKYTILDEAADKCSKLATKRDSLMTQIQQKQIKYKKELSSIADAIREEKPEFSQDEIYSYIEAFTSTLSKNILG